MNNKNFLRFLTILIILDVVVFALWFLNITNVVWFVIHMVGVQVVMISIQISDIKFNWIDRLKPYNKE